MKHTVASMVKVLDRWQEDHGEAPGELRVSQDVSDQMCESIKPSEITREIWREYGVPENWRIHRMVTKYGDVVQVTVDSEMDEGTFAVVAKEIVDRGDQI